MESTVLHFPAISQWVADGREMVGRIRSHDDNAATHEAIAGESRRLGMAARIELGMFLIKIRASMPKRGTSTNGWKAYLEAIEVDDSTAHRYMELAQGATNGTLTSQSPELRRSEGPAPDPDAPPPTDADAPGPELVLEVVEPKPNRDGWCTPDEIVAALPEVDLDPCGNPFSSVRAKTTYMLERQQNGLELPWFGLVYVNGPYSNLLPWALRLQTERTEKKSKLRGAGFLVNADSSPEWWHTLIRHLGLRLDFNERIEFKPPPGVEPSKNDRPQTLLMDAAFWKKCDRKALLAMGTLWERA